MVYAGYVPSKVATVLTTPLELAMKQIPDAATFETLKKLTQNIAQAPTEPKFRKLKLTNEKIAALVGVPGAMDTLLSLGWVRDADEVGDVLLLPPSVQLGMTNVRALDAAAERLADVLKARARSESAARARPADKDPARAAILAQMEADKRERAAKGPVTQGSVAVPKGALGPRGVGGMSVTQPGGGGGGGGGGHSHASPAGVRCVHDAAGWKAVLDDARKAGKCVIADFTATWCGPCKAVAPLFEKLAGDHAASVVCAKVDVDEAQEVAKELGVSAMPTFLLFNRAGAKAGELVGADQGKLVALFAKAAAGGA